MYILWHILYTQHTQSHLCSVLKHKKEEREREWLRSPTEGIIHYALKKLVDGNVSEPLAEPQTPQYFSGVALWYSIKKKVFPYIQLSQMRKISGGSKSGMLSSRITFSIKQSLYYYYVMCLQKWSLLSWQLWHFTCWTIQKQTGNIKLGCVSCQKGR